MKLLPHTRRAPQPAARHAQQGISLIESLMALAVTGVLVGAAVPSFEAARQQRHLDGAAAQLETDLHHLRSMAVAQNRPLRISFSRDAAGSCYVVHDGAAGDCGCDALGQSICRAGAQALRTVRYDAHAVQLRSNVPSMTFAPHTGTTTPTGTVHLQGAGGKAVNVVVNLMGRVRACTPTPKLPGYAAC